MTQSNENFEKNYQDYNDQVAALDLDTITSALGLNVDNGRRTLPFFNQAYHISETGVRTLGGHRPDYAATVILSKYLLMCPPHPHEDGQWVSFRDFRRASHFTKLNFFSSDTEKAIERAFSGRLNALESACIAIGGAPEKMPLTYDLSIRFQALPRIALLLLFNEHDDEFPAKAKVLIQKHAEWYLDPESLAMMCAHLTQRLKEAALSQAGIDT